MNKFTCTLAALVVLASVKAQKISVKDGSSSFSTGSHNAYTTTIYETTADDAESKWKSYLKDFKNEKVKSSGNEVMGDNVLIKDWGNNPVDVYATFDEDKKTKIVVMHVAYDLGGAYLSSSDGEKHRAAEKMVKEFAIKTTKESMGDKIKDLEKIASKLADNKKDLEKENKNSKSDIEDSKAKIKKAEDDIKLNEVNQEKKKAEIEAHSKLMADTKTLMDKID